ncbi:MAG TPA: DUF3800 domain-containing protein [Terracidiphilus sp.]
MEIFCDESGFTGNQLLDAQQQIFTYATVAIASIEAKELITQIRKKYKLQGDELKGGDLIKQTRGSRAVTEILQELNGKFRFAVHLKPYALASKLFEYIFEPAFSSCNSIFYEINFHRFISTLLFAFFRASDIDTGKLLENFCMFARKGDISHLSAMFPPSKIVSYQQNPLHAIGLFAEIHRKKISEEMLGFREPGVPNWILDLTTTSLYSLLVFWGQKYTALEVTCDESKPLKGDMPVFDAMIGRTNQVYVTFQGKTSPMLFNLSRPLNLAASHEVSGLQLADVIASVVGSVWTAMYDQRSTAQTERWRQMVIDGCDKDSIWPDLSDADLSTPEASANTIILLELVERSIKGENLCDGIYEMFQTARQLYPEFAARNH